MIAGPWIVRSSRPVMILISSYGNNSILETPSRADSSSESSFVETTDIARLVILINPYAPFLTGSLDIYPGHRAAPIRLGRRRSIHTLRRGGRSKEKAARSLGRLYIQLSHILHTIIVSRIKKPVGGIKVASSIHLYLLDLAADTFDVIV